MQNTLRVRRAERDGISQRGVALAAGIAFDRYFRIEKGYQEPSDTDIEKLTAYFNQPATVLFPPLAATEASV